LNFPLRVILALVVIAAFAGIAAPSFEPSGWPEHDGWPGSAPNRCPPNVR
jgi:hypothetical protein